MTPIESIILGALQGIFEWLPVSSEAINTLAMTQILGRGGLESASISIFLHSGTMLAALIYYREEFINLLKYLPDYLENIKSREYSKTSQTRIINFLIISTLASSIVGGILFVGAQKYLKSVPADVFAGLMGVALLITGIINLKQGKGLKEFTEIDVNSSILAGFLQGFALIPGISRSGSTVFALLYRDFSSEDAFKLSFLMSVPAIFVAELGLGLTEAFLGLESFSFQPSLIFGFLSSFLFGYASIDIVLRIAEKLEVAYLAFILAALSFIPLLF